MSAHIVLWLVSGSMLLIGFYNIFRNLPRRHIVINAVICLLGLCLLCLGMFIFFDKEDVPPAPYAEHNAAVLATVKEDDLLLCTDPKDKRIMHALLVRVVREVKDERQIHAQSLGQGFVSMKHSTRSLFDDECPLERLNGSETAVNGTIGQIIRFGFTPDRLSK